MNEKDWEDYITYYCVILRKFIRKLILQKVRLDTSDLLTFGNSFLKNEMCKLDMTK